MKKLLLSSVIGLCTFAVQAADDAAVTIGKWRVFTDEVPNTATLVLRSQDNFADMDLYCDSEHYEVSVYLKKKPEDGELVKFSVSIDGNDMSDKGWQANTRTRSTTVKTTNVDFIKSLIDHRSISFNYSLSNDSLEHQQSRIVTFDLTDFQPALTKAQSVCQIKLS